MPLERELNGTPGMTLMRSESLFGLSLVSMTFADDDNSFPARTIVSAHGGRRVAARDDAELRPKPRPSERTTGFASSDRHDLYELRSRSSGLVRVLLQAPGVADIVAMGGYLKEVHVETDPARLSA